MTAVRSSNVVQLDTARSRPEQDEPYVDAGPRPRSRRLVLWLVASLAFHAVLVLLSGTWTIETEPPVPLRPLEVIVVTERSPAIAPKNAPAVPRGEPPAPRREAGAQRTPAIMPKRAHAAPVPEAGAAPAPVVTAPVNVQAPPSAPVVSASTVQTPQHEGRQGGAPAVAVTPPSLHADYLNNPAPAYPASARRRGQSGMVLLRVRVSAAGKPDEVRISKSAGVDALDQAALEAVRGWTFVPARRGDVAIDAWVEVPIQFRLEGR